MTYLALYRAWRPQRFEDVIGQEHITQTLKNALRENRFSHAYLFNGPRGTGKTSTAKILSKAVNCELGPREEPCNECKTCKGITEGAILDVVEIDAASNRGVEEIRDLREKVRFAPTETRYKVYIIDEVHMLTTEAFNALLKTLEEPPAHVIFILATTEPHKLPLTIISRCQRFDFRRITLETMANRIAFIAKEEGFLVDSNAATLIARHSEGGMRDALSLLDQILSFSEKEIGVEEVLKVTGRVSQEKFSEIAEHMYHHHTAEVLNLTSDLLQEGKEPEKVIEDLLFYFRDLLLYKTAPSLGEVKDKVITDPKFQSVSSLFEEEQLYHLIEVFNQYLTEMKWTNQPRILLELAIMKGTKAPTNSKVVEQETGLIEKLESRLKELENKLKHMNETKDSFTEPSSDREKKKKVSPKPTSNSQLVKRLQSLTDHLVEEDFQKVLNKWPDILQNVKEKKVTVYAWLVNGEPVGVTDDQIIIAFKNVMHRDTTDKPNHRQLIEEEISQILGKQYAIFNVMQKDWKTVEGKSGSSNNREDAKAEGRKKEEDLVSKAIELFGEDLVEIKD